MKRSLIVFSILVILSACGTTNIETTDTPTTEWVLVGNYGPEDQNRLVAAANAANIKYELVPPYGEGCIRTTDCVWDSEDMAFRIEKGTEEQLWIALEAICRQENITHDVCSPQSE